MSPKMGSKNLSRGGTKFTSWYHQKGTLKKPTIVMQEPDSDTNVSNSGLNRSRA